MNIKSLLIGIFMAIPLLAISENVGLTVAQHNSTQATLPERPLNNQSLNIKTEQNKNFLAWEDREHADSFALMQKTITLWKQNNISTEYLVYGKMQPSSSFTWEMVPHYQPSSFISRFWQQLQILYKISFGTSTRAQADSQNLLDRYRKMFHESFSIRLEQHNPPSSRDPFCIPAVIEKQTVLEGRQVNVLFSYTPIGFGGEKLHFLIIPKAHRATFADLTEAEYQESTQLAKRVITYFSQSREIQSVYLFHKSGINAGQTVPHWHMHVVLTANRAQDFFGKLTVFKNMLIGASPMRDPELLPKVAALKAELKKSS